ncbi:MAG: DUF1801 domain-containing protein [Caldilineaceae bacterium]
MNSEQAAPTTIDEYIAGFPSEIQQILEQIRHTIRQAAPDAKEVISYRMPAFAQHGVLVFFAAFKAHIGLYPPVTGDEELIKEAALYAGPKGNLRFPLDQPIPYDLISRIVRFRVVEHLAKAAAKQSQKKSAPKKAKASPKQVAAPWPKGVAAPAQRALAAAGYTHLEQLTAATESELAALHGMGPKALAVLRAALLEKGLTFADG